MRQVALSDASVNIKEAKRGLCARGPEERNAAGCGDRRAVLRESGSAAPDRHQAPQIRLLGALHNEPMQHLLGLLVSSGEGGAKLRPARFGNPRLEHGHNREIRLWHERPRELVRAAAV